MKSGLIDKKKSLIVDSNQAKTRDGNNWKK
jgi:hypothetical protein